MENNNWTISCESVNQGIYKSNMNELKPLVKKDVVKTENKKTENKEN